MIRPDFEGARDGDAGNAKLAERFRRHADALVRGGRSPLYIELMRGAAADLDRGGVVEGLFEDIPTPPGSVPPLRLLGALHRLVLEGRAPQLAAYCPSAGGALPPAGAWPIAAEVLHEHFDEVRERVTRTVQTNEPGRAVVIDGALLGDAGSPLVFDEPWQGRPVPDPSGTSRALRVVRRAGCDLAPLDLASAGDRLTVRSYLWPDELDRLTRLDAALAVAAEHTPAIAACGAERWLPGVLADPRSGELTVIWQSVMRQYVPAEAWAAIEQAVADAARAATPATPLAWITMEPGDDPLAGFLVTATTWPGGGRHRLGRAGDHGPPVTWRGDH